MTELPVWVRSLQNLKPQFQAASQADTDLNLKAAAGKNYDWYRDMAVALRLSHEHVMMLNLPQEPGSADRIAYLYGARRDVEHFTRLAADAGAYLPREFLLGPQPDQYHAAWVAFLFCRLRSHPGHLLLPASPEENRDFDEVMVDPFLASVTAIDLARERCETLEGAGERGAGGEPRAAEPVPTGGPAGSGTGPGAETPVVIISLGGCQYAVAGQTYRVTDAENAVLQAFLPAAGAQLGDSTGTVALSQGDLIDKTGWNHAPKVLKKLLSKYNRAFAPAIRLPGGKGQGGYTVGIKRAR
jgi:hypothetical protein